MGANNPWFVVSASACGLLWLVAYVLIIRRGFLDRTYGMPLVPLCVNFAYELIFGAVWPDDFPVYITNLVWAGLDAVMVYQYLRFGRDEWPAHYPKRLFYPTFAVVLAMAAISIVTITIDAKDQHGGNLTGWGAQLMLSAGSIFMLLRRNSPKGQSMYIGLARMLGTISLIYAQESYERPFMFLRFVYFAQPLLDLAYLWLLHRTCRAHGISPWRRL
jgi:hypothetical protein